MGRRGDLVATEQGPFWAIGGNTFPIKEAIKAEGGFWNAERKQWCCSLEAANRLLEKGVILHVERRVKVGAHCHYGPHVHLANEVEIARGYALLGCDKCDSLDCKDRAPILGFVPPEVPWHGDMEWYFAEQQRAASTTSALEEGS
jgi:hypothetical protein